MLKDRCGKERDSTSPSVQPVLLPEDRRGTVEPDRGPLRRRRVVPGGS